MGFVLGLRNVWELSSDVESSGLICGKEEMVLGSFKNHTSLPLVNLLRQSWAWQRSAAHLAEHRVRFLVCIPRRERPSPSWDLRLAAE